ncbi:MAG: hypothetical protein HY332_00200 [Chloroflexi bacterium]|nr:hypothetical protein [Chloroflexota bacterium]
MATTKEHQISDQELLLEGIRAIHGKFGAAAAARYAALTYRGTKDHTQTIRELRESEARDSVALLAELLGLESAQEEEPLDS